jgi:hypothetical protein
MWTSTRGERSAFVCVSGGGGLRWGRGGLEVRVGRGGRRGDGESGCELRG